MRLTEDPEEGLGYATVALTGRKAAGRGGIELLDTSFQVGHITVVTGHTAFIVGFNLIDAFLAPDTGEFWVMEYGMGHGNSKTYARISDEDMLKRGLTPGAVEEYIASGIFQATIQNEPELQAMYEEVKAGL